MSLTSANARVAAPRRSPAQRSAPPKPRFRVIGSNVRSNSRFAIFLAVSIIFGSLMLVVGSHTMLAEGQLDLGRLNRTLSQEQAVHRTTILQVAALETPARISSEASTLKLTTPIEVLQLPTVPLEVPLPPVVVTPLTAGPNG